MQSLWGALTEQKINDHFNGFLQGGGVGANNPPVLEARPIGPWTAPAGEPTESLAGGGLQLLPELRGHRANA